ncbi:MAG: menaquinone biosynthesis protein [Desulfovibrio sp.]|nr:menaquinone biosynthesis protein [Desulfovibrio sp.]
MRRKRLGRIGFLNVLPVHYALEKGIIRHGYEIVSATPAELNRRIAGAQLDASAVSCVEYARRAENYLILPDLSISSNGPVRSVVFLSRRPFANMAETPIVISVQSHTSVLLLRLLLDELCGLKKIMTITGHPGSEIVAGNLPEAFLAIGDEALRYGCHPAYPHRMDLGAAWKELTGLPFVFALWIVRRRAFGLTGNDETSGSDRPAPIPHGERAMPFAFEEGDEDDPGTLLRASRDWGMAHMDEVLTVAAAAYPFMDMASLKDYFSCLRYSLGDCEQAGLKLFWQKLVRAGELSHLPELVFLQR